MNLISSTNYEDTSGYIYSDTPSSNDYISTTTSDTGVLQTIVTRNRRFHDEYSIQTQNALLATVAILRMMSGNLISTSETSLDPNTLTTTFVTVYSDSNTSVTTQMDL
jgi:hypothetical protein